MAESVRWYHGGFPGLKRGQQILPPSVTGAVSIADTAGVVPDGLAELVGKVYRPEVVYVTQVFADALFFASVAPAYGGITRGGDVYEVTPDGPLVPDPDYKLQDGRSMTCCSATIVRAVERRVPRPTPQAMAFLAGVR